MKALRLLASGTPWRLCLLLWSLVAAPIAAADDGSAGAIAVVEALHTTLLASMKSTESRRARAAALEAPVDLAYDFEAICRVVTGRHWKETDAATRTRFCDIFRALSVGTYAARFEGYAGERFLTVGSNPGREGEVTVNTRLETTDGEAVRLDYLVRRGAGGWKVVNVLADGVSDLALKRAEYGRVLASDGMPALIGLLEGKVEAIYAGH